MNSPAPLPMMTSSPSVPVTIRGGPSSTVKLVIALPKHLFPAAPGDCRPN
jgi:hypothetical protein